MGYLRNMAGSESPGDIKIHAASVIPPGWLKANGAQVSRAAYAALDAAIGQTYGAYTNGAGAAGTTHLVLPDLRGEFIRGWSDGRAVDSGRVFGSAQAAAFASHNHPQTHTGTGTAADQMGAGGGSIGPAVSVLTTTDVGGPETRPRNVAMLACIKF